MMNNETIAVTANWLVEGLSIPRVGSKSFSLKIAASETEERYTKRAMDRARELIASTGNWRPLAVTITDLQITRYPPVRP
ncbi:hypothetical protein [Pseudomonas guariconensis]|uniref:hypothetical protein n=1 Tax=Pseudomonas guariconensis TaxID=1288410 RepID=UPI00390699CE